MSDNPSISAVLADDEVHAWTVPLEERQEVRGERREAEVQAEALSALSSQLSTLELERAERFVRDDLRRRFVVAHAALRTVLGRYLAVEPQDVPIEFGPHGKPRLAEGGMGKEEGGRSESPSRDSSFRLPPSALSLDLRFNLAHSGEMAVVAVTRGGEIGVDIERLRPVWHLEQLADRYFAASEATAVQAAQPSGRSAEFLAIWTAKEAVLKAIGTGLSYPLDRFAVSPALDGQWVTLTSNDEPRMTNDATKNTRHSSFVISRWWLARLGVASGYLAAVATDSQKKLCPIFHYPDDLA